MHSIRLILSILACLFLPLQVRGQAPDHIIPDTGCIQRDLKDVVRGVLHKPAKEKPGKTGSLLLVPIVGSNPATGFMVGVGGQSAFKMPGSTLYSSISGSAQYTTKSQLIFMLKNYVYTKGNKLMLTGDWRYLVFSQSTYGLGSNAPVGGLLDYQYNLAGIETGSDSLTQPMKFNFARFYQTVSFKLYEGIYAGIGYNFDYYFKIQDEKLRIGPVDTLLTTHFLYSTVYGFSTSRYYSSALNFNLVYDTRDNILNPYKGIYAMATWRALPKFLGNKKPTNSFQFEWRSFHGLSERNPRHLIAFWIMGDFSREGDFPYMTLPATAYDQRGRSGRGYTQGRFRGSKLIYGEAEYRFPISRCGGVLGGVLFVNATTANNQVLMLDLFDAVKAGYGMGLRVMIDKQTRMNLAIDVAFGQKSFGFYLAATETF
jgi:outer membrane protein assembly factor BamA